MTHPLLYLLTLFCGLIVYGVIRELQGVWITERQASADELCGQSVPVRSADDLT